MRFSELYAGQVITHGPQSISEEEMLAFAREYDPQWFHVDPERANNSLWQGLIASGWQTCGVAMRMVCAAVLDGSDSFGSPGLSYLKWEAPVRPGDELRLRIDVLDPRISERRPNLGIVRWRWRLFNQRDETVLDMEVTSLFELSSNAARE